MTDIEIVNYAFSLLGANRIASFTDADNSTEAGLASAMYEQSRNELISMHTWKFATHTVELAQISGTPLFDYDNIFQLPTDLMKMVGLSSKYPYKMYGNKMYTNYTTPKITYIKKVTDSSEFSQQFTNALIAKLAYEFCFTLTNSASLTSTRATLFNESLKYNKASDAQQQASEQDINYTWLNARSY